jgi:hypothetical protein
MLNIIYILVYIKMFLSFYYQHEAILLNFFLFIFTLICLVIPLSSAIQTTIDFYKSFGMKKSKDKDNYQNDDTANNDCFLHIIFQFNANICGLPVSMFLLGPPHLSFLYCLYFSTSVVFFQQSLYTIQPYLIFK